MNGSGLHLDLLVVAIGGIVVLSLLVKALFDRLRLPALVGYTLLGVLVGLADHHWAFMPDAAHSVFEFLAKIGVIALLFTVGLKSDLRKLLGHLEGASVVWVGNVLVSGLAGYGVALWLGMDMVSSIIVGVAMTATSVGVPAEVWEQNDAIDCDDGQWFVDVAELDDISGIVLLAILFALLPSLGDAIGGSAAGGAGQTASAGPLGMIVVKTAGMVIGKLALFGAACYLFARYAEKPLVKFFAKSESGTDTVISIISIGILIAGLAGLLGFSVAIGAFFAGLAFSRNREAVENKTPYTTLHDLFVPFFFVGIGLSVDVSVLGAALFPALVFVAVAFAGKMVGTMLPALTMAGWGSSLALGLSMVPRAEITMIIMSKGLEVGDWAVDTRLFSAMVAVVLVTCLLTPPLLNTAIKLRKTD